MPEVTPPPAYATNPPLPRLKKMVETTLASNPKYRGVEARNSDIALTICIWQIYYNVGDNPDSVVHLRRIFDLPSEDKIARVRRQFQNDQHLYMPNDPNVLIARKVAEQYWQEALGYKLTKDEWRQHHNTVAELAQSERRLK